MNNNDKFNQISTLLGALIVVFIGIIFGVQIAIYGLIFCIIAWILSYRLLVFLPNQKNRSPWPVIKEKKIRDNKITLDIHKSSNWKEDSQILLCIHNEIFFYEIKNIAVVIAPSFQKGEKEAILNRSVILQENIDIPNKKGVTDIPFLKVIKRESKLILQVFHQENSKKEIIEYEFGIGEYHFNVVFKRNDIKRTSMPVPVVVKYDGYDKVSCERFEPDLKAFPIIVF